MSQKVTNFKRLGIVMTIFSLLMWLLGLLLSFFGLDIIAEIIEWLVWVMVLIGKAPRYLKNPKIAISGVVGFIWGSIPGLNWIPGEILIMWFTFNVMHRHQKKILDAERVQMEEEELEQEKADAAIAWQMRQQQVEEGENPSIQGQNIDRGMGRSQIRPIARIQPQRLQNKNNSHKRAA